MTSWVVEATDALHDALGSIGARAVAAGVVQGDDRCARVEPAEYAGSRFEIGSITKTMTALVLAELVLEGRVALDDAVGKWVDGGDNGTITFEQLATHTSGLPRLAANAMTGPDFRQEDPYAHYDAPMAEQGLRDAEREAAGTFLYSNFGFQLLGLCLERVTGESVAALFSARIFEPLGVGDATTDTDGRLLQGEADGETVRNWTNTIVGAGGVIATIEDMAAYLSAIARPPATGFGDAIRFALIPRVTWSGRQVGLAWITHPSGLVIHDGGTAGFSTYIAVDTANERGAIAMVNRQPAPALDKAVMATALGGDPREVVPRPFEGDGEPWGAIALQFFACFVREDFDAARSMMAPSTAASLTDEKLQPGWSRATSPCGALNAPSVSSIEREQGAVLVTLVASGDTGSVTMRCWQDTAHQILGLMIQ